MTCSTICPTARLPSRPSSPEAQKIHPTGHPTWLDTQAVFRVFVGIMTVSVCFTPPSHARSFLMVPSEAFLVVMSEILEGVGRRNWRFRLLLANQLGFFGTLFSPPATVSVVQSLVFKMLHDQVAVVRKAGAQWVGTIANRLDGKFDWRDAFILRLGEELGNAKSYQQRLLYIETCVVLKRCINGTDFERLCRPTLDRLASDPVSNVKSYYTKQVTEAEI